MTEAPAVEVAVAAEVNGDIGTASAIRGAYRAIMTSMRAGEWVGSQFLTRSSSTRFFTVSSITSPPHWTRV
ncbi:hypothetical protein [Streptomyces sp. NPDC026673]|uniref:hypothetical protein n=1 Tax=Streptomyces sp. NPDC026673 TaxID=3155724 RepID=UPI0033C5AB93